MGKIIDGKLIAQEFRSALKCALEISKKDITLTILQAGDNPASNVYVRNKQKTCKEVGIESKVVKVDTPNELRSQVVMQSDLCDAMMIQLPLPDEFGDPQQYIDLIPPKKDADCLTTYNLGRLFLGEMSLKRSSSKIFSSQLSVTPSFEMGSGKITTVDFSKEFFKVSILRYSETLEICLYPTA